MTDQIAFRLERRTVAEESSFPITVHFRDRATASASVPSNTYYRLDCLSSGFVIQDWTSVTPAGSLDITIPPTANLIQRSASITETKQIIVAADKDLTTQYLDAFTWDVENSIAFP